MKPETEILLKLTEVPYTNYNEVLPKIKQQLGTDGATVFEKILGEELPHATARRAFQTAIKIACGETNVPREYTGKRKE